MRAAVGNHGVSMDRDHKVEAGSALLKELLSQDLLAIDCSGKVNLLALQFEGIAGQDYCKKGATAEVRSASLDAAGEKLLLLSRLPSGSDELDLLSATVNDFVGYVKSAGRELSAIVLGQGPGSFTGLRIATALAQGLAVGFKIPLIEISSFAIAHFAAKAVADESNVDSGLITDGAAISAFVRGAGKGSWFYSELRSGLQDLSGSHEEATIRETRGKTRYRPSLRVELLSDEQLLHKLAIDEKGERAPKLFGFEGEDCNLGKTTPLSSQVYGDNIFKALRAQCELNYLPDESFSNEEIPHLRSSINIYPWNEVHKATPLYLRPVAAKSLKERGIG